MIRRTLIVLTVVAATVSLNAEPAPSTKQTSVKSRKKSSATLKVAPATPLVEGWNNVNGEWIHSDGYKYINGQVVRTGTQTHKLPPKPPSKTLLKSVKPKPAPTPAPNSAAAKAAEKERNLRQQPASQTGTHL